MEMPKIIHLMWFSEDEYPAEIKKCISSWKKILPDYTIKLWDMRDALDIKGFPFISEAIELKKYAFASDVVRLYALYTYGGIYMDSDIFLEKRFDSFLENSKVIMFNEYHPGTNSKLDADGNRTTDFVDGLGIQAAFIISEKGNPFIKHLLDSYRDRHFYLEADGVSVSSGLISPALYAISAEDFGYKYKDTFQDLGNGVNIFPSKYIAGTVRDVNNDSFAIHLCAHSWDFLISKRGKTRVRGRVVHILKNVFLSLSKKNKLRIIKHIALK